MSRIHLVNMPYAQRLAASISLTQLQAMVVKEFGADVHVQIDYLNNEFANYLGTACYDNICDGSTANYSGFGDWYFRQVAFPQLPDNTDDFFRRYASLYQQDDLDLYYSYLEPKRRGLEAFMESLIDKYALADADIVGFTSMFMQNVACFAMARLLKKRNPNVLVVMGGANCEYPMGGEIVKNLGCIDYTFSGPSLCSFRQFVELCHSGRHSELDAIDGVLSKANLMVKSVPAGVPKLSAPGPVKHFGKELDINVALELNYDSFLQDYKSSFGTDEKNKPCLFFETSRGCWWGARAHCTFCGLNGADMAYRAMNSDAALNMLHRLFDKYAPEVTHFEAVDNIIPREYLQEVFPFLKVPEQVTLFYEVKADLSEDDLRTLAEAQVLEIQPGIEALSTSTLKLMKKGTTAFTNVKLLQYSVKYGIAPVWNLLVGFPGEKQDVYQKYVQDIPLLFHLPAPQGVFPVRFDRYSPYFTKAAQYNLKLKPLDYYDLIYPFDKASLFDLAYYFYDHDYQADYIIDMLQWIDELKLLIEQWQEKWRVKDQIPKLYTFDKYSRVYVHDSRGAVALEYEISDTDFAVLQNLATKKNRLGLLADLKPVSETAVDESLAFLKQRGLIFEEAGTMMSLNHFAEPVFPDCKFYHRHNYE